jgi:hypothetical protein
MRRCGPGIEGPLETTCLNTTHFVGLAILGSLSMGLSHEGANDEESVGAAFICPSTNYVIAWDCRPRRILE